MGIKEELSLNIEWDLHPECWIWVGHTRFGYPAFRGKAARPQVWAMYVGVQLMEHERLISTCGENLCVNPSHLRVGIKPVISEADFKARLTRKAVIIGKVRPKGESWIR